MTAGTTIRIDSILAEVRRGEAASEHQRHGDLVIGDKRVPCYGRAGVLAIVGTPFVELESDGFVLVHAATGDRVLPPAGWQKWHNLEEGATEALKVAARAGSLRRALLALHGANLLPPIDDLAAAAASLARIFRVSEADA